MGHGHAVEADRQWQERLQRIMQAMNQGAPLADALGAIVEAVQAGLRAGVARLVLRRAAGPLVTYVAGVWPADLADTDAVMLGEVAGRASVVIGEGPEGGLTGAIAAFAACPLVADGEGVGVLWCAFADRRALDEGEQGWLAIYAGLAGSVIAAAGAAERYAALAQAHAQVQAVYEAMPDAALIVDGSLRIRACNPAARRVFPALAGECVGTSLSSLDPAADLSALVELVRAGEGQAVPREFRMDDDRSFAVTVACVPDQGEAGEWRAVILQDVTRFRRLHDNMADFLSAVSHDMRNPLTFMKGYLGMLSMAGEVNAQQSAFINKIAAGFDQMSDMVEKILKAGRLDPVTGTYTLEREPCDPAELVREVATTLAGPAQEKGLILTATVGDDVPILNLDRDLVRSAMMNLAENAVKYTPAGGTVKLTLEVQDEVLIFRVQDNGYGISAQDQQKLFRRNVRIHRKEWKRIKGSGLGLFIVKNVAQRHGGTAWVESAEGAGSTFGFTIPLEGANLVGGAVRGPD